MLKPSHNGGRVVSPAANREKLGKNRRGRRRRRACPHRHQRSDGGAICSRKLTLRCETLNITVIQPWKWIMARTINRVRLRKRLGRSPAATIANTVAAGNHKAVQLAVDDLGEGKVDVQGSVPLLARVRAQEEAPRQARQLGRRKDESLASLPMARDETGKVEGGRVLVLLASVCNANMSTLYR